LIGVVVLTAAAGFCGFPAASPVALADSPATPTTAVIPMTRVDRRLCMSLPSLLPVPAIVPAE
jgi:hypothetical protein